MFLEYFFAGSERGVEIFWYDHLLAERKNETWGFEGRVDTWYLACVDVFPADIPPSFRGRGLVENPDTKEAPNGCRLDICSTYNYIPL